MCKRPDDRGDDRVPISRASAGGTAAATHTKASAPQQPAPIGACGSITDAGLPSTPALRVRIAEMEAGIGRFVREGALERRDGQHRFAERVERGATQECGC